MSSRLVLAECDIGELTLLPITETQTRLLLPFRLNKGTKTLKGELVLGDRDPLRALGLIALNDSLLRGPLTARESAVDVRVLLLDPDSPAAAIRAAEIGESAESFAAGIRLAVARLAEFGNHPYLRLQTALYSSLPTWRMLAFDGALYLSAFAPSSEGHPSGMYKLTAADDGVLHAGFLRQFEDMWRQARREVGR